MNPIISVIVPIYNVEAYLNRCVMSILNQDIQNIEVILVDDGSPDKCPQICDTYAATDKRVKVVHKVNGGLSDARNTGLEKATGKYIMFVDSDDYIVDKSFEKIMPYIETNADILVCDGMTIGSNYSLKHSGVPQCEILSGIEFLTRSYQNGAVSMAAWLNIYRREFLEIYHLRFKKGILHEDEEFTPRVFIQAESVVYTGVDVYRYVIRENSITTNNDKRKNLDDLYETFIELHEIYNKITEIKLKNKLIDTLAEKYLSKFYEAEAFRYSAIYSRKEFVWRNSRLVKTKAKALLFCLSPKLYCWVNHLLKR